MIVITAGHVDHGKTSLIKALTGTDADRLPEEKRKGMTIDIGFASLRMPDGTLASFVDVPGHHKFVRNMIAGAAGTSCAVLVVACDDGIMPQTLEHLKIIDFLGLTRLCVALTKIDAVSAERVAAVHGQVEDLLASTWPAGAAVVPVSSVTGEGLAEVQGAIVQAAVEAGRADDSGRFRMSVDRVFVVAGAGLVVTGTVRSGRAQVGAQLSVAPRNLSVRIRGIQANGNEMEEARAGGRYALNLVGPQLSKDALSRGAWILDPFLNAPTRILDIELLQTKTARLAIPSKGRAVHAHIGTDDLPGRIWRINTDDEGPPYVRLMLGRPAAALYGDRIVIRDHAGKATLAGGRIIDPFPPQGSWKTPERFAWLREMSKRDWRHALLRLLELAPVDTARFACARNLEVDAVREHAAEGGAVFSQGREIAFGASLQAHVWQRLLAAMADHHEKRPHDFGITVQALIRRAGLSHSPDAVKVVLGSMIAQRVLTAKGRLYRLTSHVPEFSRDDHKKWRQVRNAMQAEGLRPPQTHELARELEWEAATLEAFLRRAELAGHVTLAAPRRYFPNDILLELANRAKAIAAENPKGTFSVAEFGRRTRLGRNLSVTLLEFFDRIGLTRRHGNARRFRDEPGAILSAEAIEIADHDVEEQPRKSNASGDARGLQIR